MANNKAAKAKSMTKFEGITLIVAVLSLIISVSTFVWNESKDYQLQTKKDKQILLFSYRLGFHYGALETYENFNEIFKIASDDSNFEELYLMSIQSLINELELTVPLSDTLTGKDYTILGNDIFSLLGDKYGREAGDAYQLGLYLGSTESTILFGEYKTDTAETRDKFYSIVDEAGIRNNLENANKLLRIFDVDTQIDTSLPLTEMFDYIQNLDKEILNFWSGETR